MESLSSRAYTFFRNFNPFHSIIHYYVDLSCFLVTAGQPMDWWALNRRKRNTSLFHLEVKYRSAVDRGRLVAKSFDKVKSTRVTAFSERFGFKDFYVPIVHGKELLGFLQAGAFSTQELTLSAIDDCWKKLSGLEPSQELPEYREFTRILLDIPVLDGKLSQDFQKALELFARLLADDPDPVGVGRELQELLVRSFSKGLPHSYWLDWALGRPTSESVPPWAKVMEDWGWTRNEIGLTRVPTTVLAVVPRRGSGPGLDWARETLRTYRFQRRSFTFGHSLPQTVGGRLDDYGAVFVTSADPKLGRLAQKQEIQDLARKIRDFARKELGCPVLVGVGETVSPGDPLNGSYRQAVLALHLRHDPEKDILHFQRTGKEGPGTDGHSQLRRTLDDLEQALFSGSLQTLESAKERFLELALNLSIQDPHEIRWHFRYALDRLAATVVEKLDFGKEEGVGIRESLGHDLDQAPNTRELVAAFQKDLSRLMEIQSKPSSVGKDLSMKSVREFIDRHFMEALPVSRLATMAGTSVSTFSRSFKKLTGSGLETYLQNLRVEEAKRLLRSTNWPVARIVKDCGFRSDSYFTRLFHARTGSTPKEFRQKTR